LKGTQDCYFRSNRARAVDDVGGEKKLKPSGRESGGDTRENGLTEKAEKCRGGGEGHGKYLTDQKSSIKEGHTGLRTKGSTREKVMEKKKETVPGMVVDSGKIQDKDGTGNQKREPQEVIAKGGKSTGGVPEKIGEIGVDNNGKKAKRADLKRRRKGKSQKELRG